MSWADKYIEELLSTNEVTFTPFGNSMQPLIESGDTVKVIVPLLPWYKTGDIVLCRVKGKQYLHLVTYVRPTKTGLLFEISNNKGKVNGWIRKEKIYGRCVEVNGKKI
jgi:hypothetical protein